MNSDSVIVKTRQLFRVPYWLDATEEFGEFDATGVPFASLLAPLVSNTY